jgi:predicted ATPase
MSTSEAKFGELVESARTRRIDGASLESVLQNLRQAGMSPVESIRAVVQIEGASLANAKTLVWSSEAWRDRLDEQGQLEDALIAGAPEPKPAHDST